MRKMICIYIYMAFMFSNYSLASCSQSEAVQAEANAAILKNWNDIFDSFRKYSHCDDGAIAEGYSESVSQMLANHWDQIDKLEKLIKKNTKFGDFVIRHIDQTIADDARLKIVDNALKRCPSKSKVLCKKISFSAKRR